MSAPWSVTHPDREGIFRYYLREHAPWDYFQPATNPDAPRALLVDAAEQWTVTVLPQLVHDTSGKASATGRRELNVHSTDDDAGDEAAAVDTHPLHGTLYDTDDDALRAAYDAGLKAFRVAD